MNNSLFLNANLYTIEHINRAIFDFSALCKITVERNGDYFCCWFNTILNAEIIMKEFENYLIDLTNIV